MKRTLACASLLLLGLLTACPNRQTMNPGPDAARPDYESVRQHAGESHQSLDQEKGPPGE